MFYFICILCCVHVMCIFGPIFLLTKVKIMTRQSFLSSSILAKKVCYIILFYRLCKALFFENREICLAIMQNSKTMKKNRDIFSHIAHSYFKCLNTTYWFVNKNTKLCILRSVHVNIIFFICRACFVRSDMQWKWKYCFFFPVKRELSPIEALSHKTWKLHQNYTISMP